MAGLERQRRRRKIDSTTSITGISSIKCAMDLFVPIPLKQKPTKQSANTVPTIQLSQAELIEPLVSRLKDTGYSHIALTHIVNGNPRDPEDRANIAIPLTLYAMKNDVTILRRLHVIVENQSDMRIFNPQSKIQKQLLAEYDLISIAPRSDAVFQVACTCDNIDIVTLDGTTSTSNNLPYIVRSTDIRAIRNRKAVLEIPYAVPILNRNARKGLVQTCRHIITSSLGGGSSDVPATTSMIPILFSSGNRSSTSGSNTTFERQADVGSIAFRTPDDLVNVLQSVLSFDTTTAIRSVTESGQVALHHGIARQKRFCEHYEMKKMPQHHGISVIGVEMEGHQNRDKKVKVSHKKTRETHSNSSNPSSFHTSIQITQPSAKVIKKVTRDQEDTDSNDEDGFLAL